MITYEFKEIQKLIGILIKKYFDGKNHDNFFFKIKMLVENPVNS